MLMIEQKVETRTWNEVRGLTENSQCKIFWLDAKCQQTLNIWQDITERLW